MSSLAPGQAAPTATNDEITVPRPTRSGSRITAAWTGLRESGLDLRNTWQIVAGAILLPVGVAVILIGWSGAAHGRVDQQQIPYLISGGILGLALVIVGCFFFWAHWLYRIYDQADLHRQAALQEHNELLRALLQAVGQRPAGAGEPATASGAAAADAAAATPPFVATPSGTNFHTPTCPIVAGRTSTLRPVTAAEAKRMKACRICEPGGS